jgi:hypothetical protein
VSEQAGSANSWTEAQHKFLKMIAPKEPATMNGSAFSAKGNLKPLLEDACLEAVRAKRSSTSITSCTIFGHNRIGCNF